MWQQELLAPVHPMPILCLTLLAGIWADNITRTAHWRKDEQINCEPEILRLIPFLIVATLSINLGLKPAPKYTGYTQVPWLYNIKQKMKRTCRWQVQPHPFSSQPLFRPTFLFKLNLLVCKLTGEEQKRNVILNRGLRICTCISVHVGGWSVRRWSWRLT